MSFIVADVGNTSVALGLWNRRRVTHILHCDGGMKEAQQAAARMVCDTGAKAIGYISVVPSADKSWKKFAKANALAFHQATYEDFPYALDYPEPRTIGADRLADAAGALERYGAGVIVMDFGTALTAAVITSDKVWRGGVIAPGFPLMRDYLFERTAKLPRMPLGDGKAPKIGRSTEEAMRFGAIVGYRGMVREIANELKKNFAEDFKLIATGGFAKWALAASGMDFTIDPTLTLYGAGLLCEKHFL